MLQNVYDFNYILLFKFNPTCLITSPCNLKESSINQKEEQLKFLARSHNTYSISYIVTWSQFIVKIFNYIHKNPFLFGIL